MCVLLIKVPIRKSLENYLLILVSWLDSWTEIYEGGCPCRLNRPMRERKDLPQRLQLKVLSCMTVETPWIFLLWRFSLKLALRESSKVKTTWWTMRCKAWRSAASVDHWWWSMWQVPRILLREYSKRLFTVHLSQYPVESSPYWVLLGRQ